MFFWKGLYFQSLTPALLDYLAICMVWFKFNDQPVLKLNGENRSWSWNGWLKIFVLSMEFTTLKSGIESIDSRHRNVFLNKTIALALQNPIAENQ